MWTIASFGLRAKFAVRHHDAMTIARLKITLDEVEPAVVRRIEVPAEIPLSDLHLMLQAAMPWENYHMHEFRAGKRRWGEPWPEEECVFGDGPQDEADVTLDAAIAVSGRKKSLTYLYDFGDGWQHTVKLEKLVQPEDGVS
jgi:hypothetical protein